MIYGYDDFPKISDLFLMDGTNDVAINRPDDSNLGISEKINKIIMQCAICRF